MPMPMSSQIKAGREGVGLFENALSMLTSAAGEPAAGMVALAELIRGGDSGAARDAVRQAFAYQPRTDAGQRQQRMLGELAASAMNSAPVTTWQRGVDIAGRYSPAAGAALQTIPTAIGVAAGAKPAMQQGRALSELAQMTQNRMVQNAMTPGGINTGPIGRQKGVINVDGKKIDPSILVPLNPNDRFPTNKAKLRIEDVDDVESPLGMKFYVDNGGSLVLQRGKTWSRTPAHDAVYRNQLKEALDEFLWPYKDNEYIRGSWSDDDYNYLASGTHRGSINHATQDHEGGLSVSKSPAYGYKRYYRLSGERIGQGSDQEPLISLESAKPKTKPLSKARMDKLYDSAVEKNLRSYGIEDDLISAIVRGRFEKQ